MSSVLWSQVIGSGVSSRPRLKSQALPAHKQSCLRWLGGSRNEKRSRRWESFVYLVAKLLVGPEAEKPTNTFKGVPMRFFVLQQDTHVVQVDDYLKKAGIDLEFARYLRREALGEILVQPSNDKPGYLRYAHRLGFHWEPNAESGHVQYDYKANLMRRLVQDYARQLVHELGMPVYEVNGATMFSLTHPVVEAYASLYGDRLYHFPSGDHQVVMSYDASSPHFNLAAKAPLSYKQLPFAHFSLSDCYRHEQSGELMLLF